MAEVGDQKSEVGFRKNGKNELKTGVLELAKAVERSISALFELFHDLLAEIQYFGRFFSLRGDFGQNPPLFRLRYAVLRLKPGPSLGPGFDGFSKPLQVSLRAIRQVDDFLELRGQNPSGRRVDAGRAIDERIEIIGPLGPRPHSGDGPGERFELIQPIPDAARRACAKIFPHAADERYHVGAPLFERHGMDFLAAH